MSENDTECFDFSEALRLAKDGWVIGNQEWGDEKTFLAYRPKRFQTICLPYLCIDEVGVGILPWTPDQFDIFSEYYYKLHFATTEFQS